MVDDARARQALNALYLALEAKDAGAHAQAVITFQTACRDALRHKLASLTTILAAQMQLGDSASANITMTRLHDVLAHLEISGE